MPSTMSCADEFAGKRKASAKIVPITRMRVRRTIKSYLGRIGRSTLPLYAACEVGKVPRRLYDYRPTQHSFQQVALGGDGLGRWSQGRIAFGSYIQNFIPFCSDLSIFNLNPADAAVVSRVQRVGQAEDGG